jgi:CRISPR-associated protein Cmr4
MNRVGLVYLVKSVTPIHPGAGESVIEASDLPIQKNGLKIPLIYGPSLKGGLRSRLKSDNKELVKLLFGSEPGKTPLEAGSVAVLDALPLLIPVRSLFGGWAYVTSPWLLFTFSNRLDMVGDDTRKASRIAIALALNSLRLRSCEAIAPDALTEKVDGEDVVVLLDEYVFKKREPNRLFHVFVEMLSGFIGEDLGNKLVIVSDELISLFLSRGLRIQQRVKLTIEKTVDPRTGPWGEEQIPPDTIMFLPLLCSESRAKMKPEKLPDLVKRAGNVEIDKEGNVRLRPEEVRNVLKSMFGKFTFFIVGGDESIGRGIVEMREFGVKKNIKEEELKLPVKVEMPKPDEMGFKAPISDMNRLLSVCKRIEKGMPEGYVKELQGLPTLLAQCGVQPTYFYYRYKVGKDEKKEREWWLWEDLNGRIRKLLGMELKRDEILEPLKLMLLEWDITRFAAQLKRLGSIFKKEGGKIA